MKLKQKLKAFRADLASGELARRQPQTAQALGWMLNFALGLVLAAAPLLGSCAPFGIAVTARAGGQLPGLMCALGASLGYLLFFGASGGVKYTAAVALAFTASYVFQDIKLARTRHFSPALAALFTLLAGILGAVTGPMRRNILLPILLQTLLAWGACWFFREALNFARPESEAAERRHLVSLTVLSACVLMALSGVVLGDTVSVGRLVCLMAVLAVAEKGGPLGGAAVGCALGLAMDGCSFNAPFYTMAYASCGLLSGVFARSGRLMFLLSAILTGAVCVITGSFNGLRAEMLMELLIASGLYLLLPRPLLEQLGAVLRPGAADGESGLRRYAATRIRGMGGAFRELYATVDAAVSSNENDEDIAKVFDRAGDQVCAKCRNKNLCWNSAYLDTLAAFNDTVPRITERGVLAKEDLPSHFLERCRQPDALVAAVNGELRGRMYRRQLRARLSENRAAAYSQYLDVAEALEQAADELQSACGPDHLARRRHSRYLSAVDADADLSVFRDRVGRLHILLESPKLDSMLREPGWLDKLSAAVGVRLCRPLGADTGAEGRVTLMEAEPLCVSVGIASLKKEGERVSGDRGTYFKTEQGQLCVILSDGMGSGEEAARESVSVVGLLERFLRTGMEPAVAMKLLNSMMLLKSGDSWGFATVDLMCVDLFTGEAAFYKYGAAPSYIRTGKSVRRIRSETLAAGLQGGSEALPDTVHLRLKPGSVALIASDGVIAETNDDWLRALLSKSDGKDTKALAKETLQTALRQYGCGDDMTVLALRLDHRA